MSPVMIASTFHFLDLAYYFIHDKKATLLSSVKHSEHGMVKSAPDALDMACYYGCKKLVSLLLDHPEHRQHLYQGSIHRATSFPHYAMMGTSDRDFMAWLMTSYGDKYPADFDRRMPLPPYTRFTDWVQQDKKISDDQEATKTQAAIPHPRPT
jgi:hypothetical protein